MNEPIFMKDDGCYAITPEGPRKISGCTFVGSLPEGDWVMAVFGGKFIVIVDRSGQHLPFVAWEDKFEQMKIEPQKEPEA